MVNSEPVDSGSILIAAHKADISIGDINTQSLITSVLANRYKSNYDELINSVNVYPNPLTNYSNMIF